MDRFDAILYEWTRVLTTVEKRILGDMGIGCFLCLRQVKVEEDFLDACLQYWDPAYSVFRFPGGEMCPLVEEFIAIAGWERQPLPVVLRLELSYRNRFRDFFSLSRVDVDSFFIGTQISMVRFASKFVDRNDASISPVARKRALAYCLLQRYGFTSMLGESALGDPRLLAIVEQMELGRNPASLILAETILGLGERLQTRTRDYRGCPRLLQIWLMEHMRILADVGAGVLYRVNSLTSRALSWAGARHRPIGYFADFVRGRQLRWIVPWWNIQEFTGSSVLNASSGVMLCGFSFAVWIHPLRVMRQMGLAQVIPREDTRRQYPVALSGVMRETWAVSWENRAIWRMPAVPATIWVSGGYLRWIVSRDVRDNARFRAIEERDLEHRQGRNRDVPRLEAPPTSILGKRSLADGPSKGNFGSGAAFGEGSSSRALIKPKESAVFDRSSKGVPGSGAVFKRLGEGSSSRALIKPREPGVFDRLGYRPSAKERLGARTTVCGLKAKETHVPMRPRVVLQSKVVGPAPREDSDEEDRDQNPKRKK